MEAKVTSVTSAIDFSGDINEQKPFMKTIDKKLGELHDADVLILTSDGLRIPAHASILASVSPVIESIIDRPGENKSSERIIPILGVPSDAVAAFVRFVYSSRCSEEQMKKYGIHLLALSHVFMVPQLKRKCSKGLSERLTIENVVDVFQLARLCDAPDLYLNCMKLVSNHFKAVEKTEGWKFMQDHDPWLELDILQFIDESERRKRRSRRHREEQRLYFQLSEAMECLEHICTEGCTHVGPYDKDPSKNMGPCSKFATCQGLQMLIKHFATCKKRVNGGCLRCKRMWQLLRLHSSICDKPDHCRVPLCRQFKLRTQEEKKASDARWRLLVRKVMSAKAISTFVSAQIDEKRGIKRTLNDHGLEAMNNQQCQFFFVE